MKYTRKCPVCGTAFHTNRSNKMLCSRKCKLVSVRGIYRTLRRAAMERDQHTCRDCGEKPERLEMHHITPRALGGLNELDNVKMLCKGCHKKYHYKGWLNDLRNGTSEGVRAA